MSSLPPLSLLSLEPPQLSDDSAKEVGDRLMTALASFHVKCTLAGCTVGPTITRFDVKPAAGVKIKQITSLADDLALAMAAESIRIIAPVPGKGVVGIEIPNPDPATVHLRSILASPAFLNSKAELPLGLGRDIEKKTIVVDLAEMPHLLIAGTTGSGKSVCLNTIIGSLLYRYTPEGLRMLMVDPKMVELSVYNGLPHLRHEVVTSPAESLLVLDWAIAEMESRYILLSENKCRNLEEYNSKIGGRGRLALLSTRGALPYLVVVIDEMGDLMMVEPDVEERVARLAQKARAVGIHLVIATQRPSVDIITGLIKANFPSRIAFRVFSATDSRVILDGNGAEKLIGHGDMLLTSRTTPAPIRLQGAFVSTEETVALVKWWKEHWTKKFDEPLITSIGQGLLIPPSEPLLRQAAELAAQRGFISCADLQIGFKIGFTEAARIVDQLVQRQVISAERFEDGAHALVITQDDLKRMIL